MASDRRWKAWLLAVHNKRAMYPYADPPEYTLALVEAIEAAGERIAQAIEGQKGRDPDGR